MLLNQPKYKSREYHLPHPQKQYNTQRTHIFLEHKLGNPIPDISGHYIIVKYLHIFNFPETHFTLRKIITHCTYLFIQFNPE